ncbi:C4-dicarboxylate ABC transporter [Thalassobaculum fulvum]|jgi:TRAP-type mannitol/chloroaromatic compound transport system permease small subunit|uniref:TRAP transporter small permease protein n=1 Tax=Thalassobaculum fulvum TaxID=1633335 RepID=A0A919CQP6_9PROT|nr:TRAP transporter small permease subunit [Thalassobaculum fulvum]GHD53698.1 C4-dicarboxylate ABC transporter [Thalassobaculum fulvum]
MGAITAIARAVTTTNLWIARVINWAVLILFILLLMDVIMRKVVGAPISWSQQASRLIFGVYAVIGGGYLLARREHVNVDLFYATFSKKRKAAVDIATSFLFFSFMIVLLPNAYDMAAQSVCMTEGVPPWCKWEVDELAVWKAPLWPSKWLIVVATVLLLLQGIVKLAADVMIVMGIEVDESAYGPVTDGAEDKVDA